MASGFPDWTPRVFTSATNFEQMRVLATAVEATNAFTQQVKSVLIYNDGNNPAHINFDDTALVTHLMIPAKSWAVFDLQFTDLHTICAAGHTATLYVVGTY